MKKRALSMLLAGTLVLGSLAGCGSSKIEEAPASDAAEASTAVSAAASAAEEAASTAPEEKKDGEV